MDAEEILFRDYVGEHEPSCKPTTLKRFVCRLRMMPKLMAWEHILYRLDDNGEIVIPKDVVDKFPFPQAILMALRRFMQNPSLASCHPENFVSPVLNPGRPEWFKTKERRWAMSLDTQSVGPQIVKRMSEFDRIHMSQLPYYGWMLGKKADPVVVEMRTRLARALEPERVAYYERQGQECPTIAHTHRRCQWLRTVERREHVYFVRMAAVMCRQHIAATDPAVG